MWCQLLLEKSDEKKQTTNSATGLASSAEVDDSTSAGMEFKNKMNFRKVLAFIIFFSILSLACLILGVYLYRSSTVKVCRVGKKSPLNRDQETLMNFMSRVKADYFKFYPNEVYADPDLETHTIINNFSPYDPGWQTLKARTDHALKLRKELTEKNIDTTKLRPREKKAYAQLQHYLESMFGNPYDENYYAGDWMLGPNYFCWQHICSVPSTLKYHFNIHPGGFMPKTFSDLEKIMEILKRVKKTFQDYQSNMVLGVKTGMVRSVEDCAAGYNKFSVNFPNIVEDGATGKWTLQNETIRQKRF